MQVRRSVASLFIRGDHFLITRRPYAKPSGGNWEFGPGGKVERGETDVCALGREIFEEAGILAKVGTLVGDCLLEYPEGAFHTFLYRCFSDQLDRIVPVDIVEYAWISLDVAHEPEKYGLRFVRFVAPLLPAVTRTIRALHFN